MGKVKIETVKLSEIHEYDGNPRQISKQDFETLKKSLKEFPEMMAVREIVVDEDGAILGGNQRYKALLANGVDEVVVKRVIDWTEEQKREFVIKDNIANGEWDMDVLANEWDDLPLDNWGIDISKWENQTEYQSFVDKFKPKLTTDDCYTPPKVFEAVEKWVREEYNIPDSVENIRPFKPEGDYTKEDYDGKVVIDNPPFSIMSEIIRFYIDKGIKFFLFYDQRTLLSTAQDLPVTRVITSSTVIYENGAKVSTGFITNMDDPNVLVYCSSTLANKIEEAQTSDEKELGAYDRPKNSASAMDLAWFVKAGKDIRIKKGDAEYIKNLDNLKAIGKCIYGGGMLINDNLAQKLAAQKLAAQKSKIKIDLSEREKNIVYKLNKGWRA